MPGDWVNAYIQRLECKREEKAAKRKKVQWAEEVALGIFGRLRRQLKHDVEQFNSALMDGSLTYSETFPRNVVIQKAVYPSGTLRIELQGVSIHCRYEFMFEEGGGVKEKEVSLRIVADDNRSVQVYRNGTPFVDESEVSEFLLTPLFDFIA